MSKMSSWYLENVTEKHYKEYGHVSPESSNTRSRDRQFTLHDMDVRTLLPSQWDEYVRDERKRSKRGAA